MIPQVRKLENYSKSTIWVGENLFQNLSKYLDKDFSNCHFITDANVYAYYQDLFPQKNVIVIPAGEASKSFTIIEKIIGELVANNADRHSFLVGVGGGVVCDIAGFVASIYMRGIDFGYVSTTLLSQVDASTGGKTGVNFRNIKNLIGTFNQPQFVLCDVSMLSTLPFKEYQCGLVEAIKHSIISDAQLFEFIASNLYQILNLEVDVTTELIYKSISIKAEIVNEDEFERSSRKKLNLGHTYGHAVESLTGISHGEAVAQGLIFDVKLSHHLGRCDSTTADRIMNILSKLDLSLNNSCTREEILKLIKNDKKKKSASVDYIFIRKIGQCEIENIPFEVLDDFMKIAP